MPASSSPVKPFGVMQRSETLKGAKDVGLSKERNELPL